MEMPKPGDSHKRLSGLVGTWVGTEKLHPAPWDPTGGPATSKIVNRTILDGFAIVQEYEQRRGGGRATFKGHGVIWFDAEKQQYVMTWWDSMGGKPGEYRGSFSGNMLQLSSPMPQGGHSRVAFDLSKRGRYKFLMEISEDGKSWNPAMEANNKLATPKPRAAKRKPAARKARTKARK